MPDRAKTREARPYTGIGAFLTLISNYGFFVWVMVGLLAFVMLLPTIKR
jgi:hypothetical protein